MEDSHVPAGERSTLSAALGRLNSQAGLDDFLSEVAAELLRRTGAAELIVLTYDPAEHTLTMKLRLYGGNVRFGPCGDEVALFAAPFSADVTPAFGYMAREKRLFTPAMSPIPAEQFAFPGGLDWLTSIHASDATAMGLHIGDEVMGTLHLHFTDGRHLKPVDEPFFLQAADEMAIALKFWNLSQRATAGALVLEREQAAQRRVAELAKANDALRRTSARLSGGSLGQFLEGVVAEACHATGADNGAVFLLERDGDRWVLRMRLFVEAGCTLSIADDARFDLWNRNAPVAADVRTWNEMVRGDVTIDHIPGAAPNLWPPSVPWHAMMGHQTVVCAPMHVGERLIGLMGYGFKCRCEPQVEMREVIMALAQQAGIAVHLERLADRARDAAVASEREQSARQHAEQLERANIALRDSIDALEHLQALDELVPPVLRAVAQAFGAGSCALFEHPAETVYLRYWYMDGRVLTVDEILAHGDERLMYVKQLASGFEVPLEYLGTTVNDRTRAVFIDHALGTCVPEFDAFSRGLNCASELMKLGGPEANNLNGRHFVGASRRMRGGLLVLRHAQIHALADRNHRGRFDAGAICCRKHRLGGDLLAALRFRGGYWRQNAEKMAATGAFGQSQTPGCKISL